MNDAMSQKIEEIIGTPMVLGINVGGTIYTSTSFTLTQYADSKLAEVFSKPHLLPKDSKGNYFLDRDGPMFRHVMNFLRTSKLKLPDDFRDFDQLLTEAEYFNVKPLIDAVKKQTRVHPGAKGKSYLRLSFSKREIILAGLVGNLEEIIPDAKEIGGTIHVGPEYSFKVEGVSVNGGQIKAPCKVNQVDAMVQRIVSHGYDIVGSRFDGQDNQTFIFTRK